MWLVFHLNRNSIHISHELSSPVMTCPRSWMNTFTGSFIWFECLERSFLSWCQVNLNNFPGLAGLEGLATQAGRPVSLMRGKMLLWRGRWSRWFFFVNTFQICLLPIGHVNSVIGHVLILICYSLLLKGSYWRQAACAWLACWTVKRGLLLSTTIM